VTAGRLASADSSQAAAARVTRLLTREDVIMATKDKNSKKSMAKKPAQRTLKEKREAKKNKK